MAFLEKLKAEAAHNGQAAAILKYVTGDDKIYSKLVPESYDYWVGNVGQELSHPGSLSPAEQRFVRACAKVSSLRRLENWLAPVFLEDEGQHDYFSPLAAAVGDGDAEHTSLLTLIIDGLAKHLENPNGRPNSAGKYLLAQPADKLGAAAEAYDGYDLHEVLRFLLKHNPQLAEQTAPQFVLHKKSWRTELELDKYSVGALVEADAKKYEPLLLKMIDSHPVLGEQFEALSRVASKVAKHLPRAQELALKIMEHGEDKLLSFDYAALLWLLQQYGVDSLPHIGKYVREVGAPRFNVAILHEALKQLDERARPLFLDAAPSYDAATALLGIEQLVKWGKKEDHEAIVAAIVKGLQNKNFTGDDVVKFLRLLAAHDLTGLQEHAWKLLDHKSKPVRSAAARTLGGLGDAAVKRAADLAAAKKATTRSAAVTLLATAGTPAATAALEARVDAEEDDEVRDQILLALEQVWDQQGKKLSRPEIDARVERAQAKLAAPLPAWLNEQKLPPLKFAGKQGETLSPQHVRYLIYRQSRAKEMRADVEAKPLYALLDRESSGDFGLFILQSFFGSKMEAEDRWALALAGLTGDDRCVTAIQQQIRKWVDSNRGKLAEYAAQALALIGSDVALCAVDSLSIRYRSKQKNIGKAAGEAFADAAERLGVTPDELGDRVVPWLGFEPGQPRLIAAKNGQIEARIGLDHKLEFRDLAKGKKIGTLPAGVAAEVKTEFKELGATLREVVKGQLARMENLMVRQFRWPVARWEELYLQHPLLFPFAVQQIWGNYNDQGQLLKTFRTLEDRTLTDEADNSVPLPKSGTIGLIHPLELSAELRQAWMTHLADYNISPPVLQITRPVVFPTADEQGLRMSTKYQGTQLNAMTFRSRAERLGWQRGSVTDGGGVTNYRKGFPGGAADALIETDGLYIGIGMEESIRLGKFYFVKAGSVRFGSYTYDEPNNDIDPRLIPFGQVAPIVFSETVGDLGKITGKQAEETEDAAE